MYSAIVKTAFSNQVFAMTGFNYGITSEEIDAAAVCKDSGQTLKVDLEKMERVTFDSLQDFEKFTALYTEVENKVKHLLALADDKHIIRLWPLAMAPLSSQLARITGDPYCVQSFVNGSGEGLNAYGGNVIVHIKTGLKFLIPINI